MTNIEEELNVLATLPPAQLRERWMEVTGAPLPKISARLLHLALAYELQVRATGGLSKETRQRLAQLEGRRTRTSAASPGTRLVRSWNGAVHVVTIGEDGTITWNGQRWASLSAVARAITGTRWSGPAFFGLRQKVAS